jgi:hypothetical protein
MEERATVIFHENELFTDNEHPSRAWCEEQIEREGCIGNCIVDRNHGAMVHGLIFAKGRWEILVDPCNEFNERKSYNVKVM